MRVKISLTRPTSAVQLGHYRPRPPPSNGSAHNVVRCRCSLRLTLLAGALVATAWARRARPQHFVRHYAPILCSSPSAPPLRLFRQCGRAGSSVVVAPPLFPLWRGGRAGSVVCGARSAHTAHATHTHPV